MRNLRNRTGAFAIGLLLAQASLGQDYVLTEEGMQKSFKPPSYSPYAGRNFPTKLLWGDTHLHTNLSLAHTPNLREFRVSWTGGFGNGGHNGCEIQYRIGRGPRPAITASAMRVTNRRIDRSASSFPGMM